MVASCDARVNSHSMANRRTRNAKAETRPDAAQCHSTLNPHFSEIIHECSARSQTWITPDIIAVYEAWHRQGRAHSVETWQGDGLIGGLYGVSLGRFFFGESMFTRVPDADRKSVV